MLTDTLIVELEVISLKCPLYLICSNITAIYFFMIVFPNMVC